MLPSSKTKGLDKYINHKIDSEKRFTPCNIPLYQECNCPPVSHSPRKQLGALCRPFCLPVCRESVIRVARFGILSRDAGIFLGNLFLEKSRDFSGSCYFYFEECSFASRSVFSQKAEIEYIMFLSST